MSVGFQRNEGREEGTGPQGWHVHGDDREQGLGMRNGLEDGDGHDAWKEGSIVGI